ncbi:hypothetical protein EGW08_017158 [Elysia chlorotica]|uniref:Uncharacterized protein n=1 Tax=Elysia chlorotica TaxID=188477 RepID=A0A3S0ZDA3_ELYCH|nr:hypothetical protein EGW08_017158 [Elysia chlorotica]
MNKKRERERRRRRRRRRRGGEEEEEEEEEGEGGGGGGGGGKKRRERSNRGERGEEEEEEEEEEKEEEGQDQEPSRVFVTVDDGQLHVPVDQLQRPRVPANQEGQTVVRETLGHACHKAAERSQIAPLIGTGRFYLCLSATPPSILRAADSMASLVIFWILVLNRHIKKSNDTIRENITILEDLEKDKEKRARHILATYLKVQKKKTAVNIWTQKYCSSLAQKQRNATPSVEKKDEGPFVNIVTTRGSVSLRDFSLGKNKKKLSLPKIHLEKASENCEVEQSESEREATDAVTNVARANSSGQIPTGNSKKRDSLAESVDSLKVPSIIHPLSTLKKRQQSQDITRVLQWGDGQKRKRHILRGSVYVTFPFVYHSLGEQACPRYSLFRECTDYDPYVNKVPGTSGSQGKMSTSLNHRGSNASLKSILSTSTSRRSSQVPTEPDSLTSNSRRGSKRVSFSNVAHMVRVVQVGVGLEFVGCTSNFRRPGIGCWFFISSASSAKLSDG